MRVCSKCEIEKDILEYHRVGDKFRYKCKQCISVETKEYRNRNRDKLIERSKRYNNRNKEKMTEYNKLYAKTNKVPLNEKRKVKQIEKYKSDTIYRLTVNIRNQINRAFKNFKKSKKSQEILGCTINEFRVYIELLFLDGMTWENQGEWHLDHIRPLSWAQTEEEIYRLNHYTNFQPMWGIDNIRKGNKYEG